MVDSYIPQPGFTPTEIARRWYKKVVFSPIMSPSPNLEDEVSKQPILFFLYKFVYMKNKRRQTLQPHSGMHTSCCLMSLLYLWKLTCLPSHFEAHQRAARVQETHYEGPLALLVKSLKQTNKQKRLPHSECQKLVILLLLSPWPFGCSSSG